MSLSRKWRVLRHPGEDILQRAHDSAWLRRRWQAWTRQAGWTCRTLVENGEKIDALFSPDWPGDGRSGWYFSAGIHGDEPAATLGLLLWAEANVELLPQQRAIIFPCLNPWGLRENSRRDAHGLDLNRVWHNESHPLRNFVHGLIEHKPCAFFATLHEDFDARGIYLYEALRRGVPPVGEELLGGVEKVLPRDHRKIIEGKQTTRPGLIQRSQVPSALKNSLPEALYLHRQQPTVGRVFTFETPSEFDLARRVLAQQQFLCELVRVCA